ncbi:hypothetical protein CFO_g1412 [Ceratocystis platani]|uniref:GST C-terminal domain-containing protein n=1 Tax=Ceratocystis fimbriata f. sp. platani TaxID=88771 RepID=A0A0F8B6A4_CERFI|nr:hypothetical protein CFO_g1412 [Ceratocystis platani]
MTSPPPRIVLFHYSFSPYAQRVVWYLTLRGIPYSQCHRRIPLLSIGRDVYVDTRLIIEKLEELYPEKPRLSNATTPEHKALEILLQRFTIDSGVFGQAAALLPLDLPVMKSGQWWKDRSSLFNGKYSPETIKRARPSALAEMRESMTLLETTILSDGRDWVLGTKEPTIADINAIWPFYWIMGIPGALPKTSFSASEFPKIHAWTARFQKIISAAKKQGQKPETVSGDQAYEIITKSLFHDKSSVVSDELSDLRVGDIVDLRPSDYGMQHVDTGRLVALSPKEVTIEVATSNATIHLHAPRHGFVVKKSNKPKL